MRRCALLVVLLLVACGSSRPPVRTDHPPARGDGMVRVGLEVEVDRAEFAADRRIEIRDAAGDLLARVGGTRLVASARGDRVVVHRDTTQICVGPAGGTLRASTDTEWRIGGDRFGGDLLLHPAGAGRVTLINHLGIEDYLRGVVPWEIGRPDVSALEAVKAQAIAARTYTYSHLGHWEALGFDLHDSVTDQVYRGRTGTHEITDRAVAETRGRVVAHRGQLIRAYYSSTCGGHGSTLSDVWTRQPAPYLVGRRDAGAGASWCAGSPQFRWSEVWTAAELGAIVREHLPREIGVPADSVGALLGLEIVERDGSGRVKRLRIRTDRADHEVRGDRIRWVLRPASGRFSILRSTLFNLEELREGERLGGIRVSGGGFGHGVGLCQTGALGMARAGRSARAILEHYYAGAEVVSVRDPGLAR